ncbi:SDR family NAD(P)-dependent oxidoreductase [Aquimarina sp. U1-2]|uniref:SDR family NAD(P)-dependent oxidoreductase n=1 Tax=Aquimarina sp. U1-2 TaxID=2823141 RepID=UPI001AECB065|nr:SDR family NAD(P)-dependent oxidoreductase [Aquimarina sp. U1-2]MBP2831068.1 SDR family NAD(P)-dependent oxidoreductase [Aquimarina sp. U1-2]
MKRNKVALVTEGGNGMGKKFSRILQQEGFDVILATEINSFHTLKNEFFNEQSIFVIESDFSTSERLQPLYAYIKKKYGKLDVLINNAEIANGFGQDIDAVKLNEIKELYEANFFSVIRVVQTFHDLLKRSRKGIIVNITSTLGDIEKIQDQNFPYASYKMIAYSSAKAALNMLTVLLAKETQSENISVVAFDPVLMKNCTHNSVYFCENVQKKFVELIKNDDTSRNPIITLQD